MSSPRDGADSDESRVDDPGRALLLAVAIVFAAGMIAAFLSGLTGFRHGGVAAGILSATTIPLFFFLRAKQNRPSR